MPMSSSSKSYPIAETFTSVQGEGTYAGTLMFFVRLAGCNVGHYTGGDGAGSTQWPESDFKLYQERIHAECTTAQGTRFLCDTDYHSHEMVSVEQLFTRTARNVEHLCITGGEPFLHDLLPLAEEASGHSMQIHIETSGTKPIDPDFGRATWITCSPKAGFLRENTSSVREWKFVVGSCKEVEQILEFLDYVDADPDEQPVFLQPVNNINTINQENLRMVLACIERYPWLRLSAQLHKFLEVR